MNYIETHCHLDDDAFESDLAMVLTTARMAGVGRFVNIGYEPRSWQTSLALAREYADVSYALGMHPNSAEQWSSTTAAQLELLLEHEQPVAIGETGLDFFRERADHDAQRQAFRDQLILGRRFALPIVIHMRGAVENEIIEILEDFSDVRVLLHSFDGSAVLRDFLLARGDSIGIGGLMTRAGSVELREILQSVPLEAILLETDSPYLIPRGMKTRRNTPASIPLIASVLADLLGYPVADIARVTTENAKRVLRLPSIAQVGTPS